MGEFVSGDDWDLEAVVRGYMSQASHTTCDIMEWFDSFIDDPLLRSSVQDNTQFPVDFPGSLEMATALDDLEGLFDAVMLPASLQDTPVSKDMEMNGAGKLQEGGAGKLQEGAAGSSAVAAPVAIDGVHAATAKYKRRKSQNKHVVQHVTPDSISSDLWAWRKYGQKPIKGSPYPRSYYRCSSSKGCSARKQVERSSSEPGMFIVTYTGEHSHSQPTRRSALAGITRPSKFSAPKKPATAGGGRGTNGETKHVPKLPQEIINADNNRHESSPASTATTMEDGPCKQERLVWGVSESDDKIVDLPSLGLGEEIFLGFDELEGLGMDFALNCC